MAVVTLEHNLKKKCRKIQKNFLATIFFFNLFFSCLCFISLYNIYFFFIEIGQAVFKKNYLLNFSFPLHNS